MGIAPHLFIPSLPHFLTPSPPHLYGSPETVAPQVSLSQVLSDRVNPNVVKDRIVLIGVTAHSTSDYWTIPYGDMPSEQVPGILIQAHMVSQIFSAVLDG